MAKHVAVHTRATIDLIVGQEPLPVVETTVASDRPAVLELSQPDLFDIDADRIPEVTLKIRISDEFTLAAGLPTQALRDLLDQIETAMGGAR